MASIKSRDLFFLCRFDEIDSLKIAFRSIYSTEFALVDVNPCRIENISLVHITVNEAKSVKSTRHINAISVDKKIGEALISNHSKDAKIENLIELAKFQNQREVFNFLLENRLDYLC